MTRTPNLERIQDKATKNYEIRNPKHEARNKSEIGPSDSPPEGGAPVSNFLMFKTSECFGHLDFGHLNLFRISIFGFRICLQELK